MKLESIKFEYHVDTGLFYDMNFNFKPDSLSTTLSIDKVLAILAADFEVVEQIFDKVLLPLDFKKKSGGEVSEDEINSGVRYGKEGLIMHPGIFYSLGTNGKTLSSKGLRAVAYPTNGDQKPMLELYEQILDISELDISEQAKSSMDKIDSLKKGTINPKELPLKLLGQNQP